MERATSQAMTRRSTRIEAQNSPNKTRAMTKTEIGGAW
jgi:hypothetical protein